MKATSPTKPRRSAKAITVDVSLCKACGICRAICPCDVFEVDEFGLPVAARPSDCSVCLACEWHCPDLAIQVDYDDVPRTAGLRRTAVSSLTAVGASLGARGNSSAESYCAGEDQ